MNLLARNILSLTAGNAPLSGEDIQQESRRIGQLKAYISVLCEATLTLANTESNLDKFEQVSDSISRFLASEANKSHSTTLIPTISSSNELREKLKSLRGMDGWFLWAIFAELMFNDCVKHLNMVAVVHFSKHFGDVFFSDNSTVFSEKILTEFKQLFVLYYTSAAERLKKQHSALKKMRKYQEDYQITRGNLSEVQIEKIKNADMVFNNLKSDLTVLGPILGLHVPVLDEEKGELSATVTLDFKHDENIDYSQTAWEDREQAVFYTDILDLKNFVPEIYLKECVKQSKSPEKRPSGKQVNKKSSSYSAKYELDDLSGEWMREIDEEVLREIDDIMMTDNELTEQEESSTGTLTLDNVLIKFSEIATKEGIDQLAIDFFHASAGSRVNSVQKLVQKLASVSPRRIDLLPFYARLIATIDPFIPEVKATVLAALMSEFKRRFRKQGPGNQEYRIRNVRYIGELAKFRMAPSHLIFYCFHRLLKPEESGLIFSSTQVEVICHLLEVCGRFMLRTTETSNKFSSVVDIFSKKSKSIGFDTVTTLMIESTLLHISPTDNSNSRKILDSPRSKLEWYVCKLLYYDLDCRKMSVEKIIKEVRKLPWNRKVKTEVWDPCSNSSENENATTSYEVDIQEYLLKLFTEVWKFKYQNISLLADLASGISSYHSEFGIRLVDIILENIREGLERKVSYHYHQKRLLSIKFLGELYCYRMVSSVVIFDTLFSILFFGHAQGKPVRNESPYPYLDPPDDFFRIRMVCTLLEVTGKYFGRKRLNNFLIFFEHYILTKDTDLMPLEIYFLVEDIFDKLRPSMKRRTDYTEVYEELAEIEKKISGPGYVSNEDEDEDSDAPDQSIDEFPEDSSISSDHIPQNEGHQREEEENFEAELQAIVQESMQSRKGAKINKLDLAIPMISSKPQKNSESSGENDVEFSLLMKKSKKTNVKTIQVPSDSKMVLSAKAKHQKSLEEKQKLKQLILDQVDIE